MFIWNLINLGLAILGWNLSRLVSTFLYYKIIKLRFSLGLSGSHNAIRRSILPVDKNVFFDNKTVPGISFLKTSIFVSLALNLVFSQFVKLFTGQYPCSTGVLCENVSGLTNHTDVSLFFTSLKFCQKICYVLWVIRFWSVHQSLLKSPLTVPKIQCFLFVLTTSFVYTRNLEIQKN